MGSNVSTRLAVAAAVAVGGLVGAGCAGADHLSATTSASSGPTAGAATVPRTDPTPPVTALPLKPIPPTIPMASDACAAASRSTPFDTPTTVAETTWAQQVIVPDTCPQVLDLAAGAAFALVSQSPGDEGPWQLQRFDIDRAVTETGPTFEVMTMAVAAGYLWIGCGPIVVGVSRPLLCQVDPDSLAVVGQVSLPPAPDAWVGGNGPQVVTGPADTIWVGYGRTLVHVDGRDGAILSTESIGSGTVDSLSVDPGGDVLYASIGDAVVAGQSVDAAVLELDARTGRTVVETSATSAVTSSAGAGRLTAVAAGVWTSFRTGMAGVTILLRRSDLADVAPPPSAMGSPQPDGIFSWIMDGATISGGDALFLVNENGVLACIDPSTGTVRAQEHLADAAGTSAQLLAVDAPSGRLFATDAAGLVALTPPGACWA